ncbi:MAG TPA: divergent polysaccharide deacetylase family protein [Thermoanaerobaculia bacterium]
MARRSTRSKRSGFAGFWLFLLGVLAGAGALYLGCDKPPDTSRSDDAPPAAPAREAREDASAGGYEAAPDATPVAVSPESQAGTAVPAAGEAAAVPPRTIHVALVIDDLGRSVDDLVPLERLGVPVTYAVLPFEEQTPAVVSALRSRGEEILLHLPMEPKNGEDPGPGALRLGMSDEELRSNTLAALQAVPGAAGVNNHMGSGLSADERSMSTILDLLASRGLFFLDSRTSADSVGYRTALSKGVPAAERQVFLDRDPRPEAIQEQFERLLQVARERGAAVAIGHPYPETLMVLASMVPKAREKGYEFVPVSYLLDRMDGAEDEE